MAYEVLKPKELEARLNDVLQQWDANEAEAQAFKGWAYVVAAVSDSCAVHEPDACLQQLLAERRSVYAEIVQEMMKRNVVDLELACRHAWLEYLIEALPSAERYARAA